MLLPVFSGYADGFCGAAGRSPPSPNYFFTKIRSEENVGDDLLSKRPDIDALNLSYPFLTAENGRRHGETPIIGDRAESRTPLQLQVVKLGSGVVLYGYYMFHGGRTLRGRKRRCRNRRRRDIQTSAG